MSVRAVFAGLLLAFGLVLASAQAAPPAPEPDPASVPLLAKLLQEALPQDRTGVQTTAYLLDDLGFKQRAALLRRFDERRAIAQTLGEPAPAAATVGDAIDAEQAAPAAIDEANTRLMTQAFALDFTAPREGELTDDDDPTRADAKRVDGQARFDLAHATAVAPGIWRAPSHTQVNGHPEPDLFYVRAVATSRLREAALIDLSMALNGAALPRAATLICDNQTMAPAQASAVFCTLRRQTAEAFPDEQILATFAALQRGEATATPTTLILAIGGSPHRRTFFLGKFGGISDDERNQNFTAQMAALDRIKSTSCFELGRCGGRISAMIGNSGNAGLALLFALMVWSVWWRLRHATLRASTLAFARTAFGLYALFVVLAMLLSLVDTPGGSLCRGGGLCGVLSFIATGVASLPWSWLMLKSLAANGAGDHAVAAAMWLCIVINLVWLGVMAFARGSEAAPRWSASRRSS